MTRLKLADGLSLPLDAVTQTFLVVGKRGSGKSNTAARFVEQLHHARLPFVVLDPVDTWWGLKAGRDGAKGLDVYVFGGRKADLPLEAHGGALIAEVLCEHRLSMVLSVKHLSGRERSDFMVAFAKTLFQKWAGGPLHVVLEEAHELAPQNTQNAREGEQQMLGAFKRLWKLGRSSGIGGTAITQRPASLSKDITTQSEILIAHRTIGPQDVKAVGEWVKYHGERLDILAELPTLPTGEVCTGGCGRPRPRGGSDCCPDCTLEARRLKEIDRAPAQLPHVAPPPPAATWPELQALVEGRHLRLGAYGDPAAIPFEVWTTLLSTAAGFVAYTHAWRQCDRRLQAICMASVDTERERDHAWLLGWRTFRVRAADEPIFTNFEIVCPASDEAGHRVTCQQCQLCRGNNRPARSIAIIFHGNHASHKAFATFHRNRAEVAV